MIIPHVTEISALSAHRRDVALGGWSIATLPQPAYAERPPDPDAPLVRVGDARPVSAQPFDW